MLPTGPWIKQLGSPLQGSGSRVSQTSLGGGGGTSHRALPQGVLEGGAADMSAGGWGPVRCR